MRLAANPNKDNPIGTAYTDKATGNTSFTLTVSEKIKTLEIYYESASGDRSVTLYNQDTGKVTDYPGTQGSDKILTSGDNRGFYAIVTGVEPVNYKLYTRGHSGSFCGLKYTLRDGLESVSKTTTWDFEDVNCSDGKDKTVGRDSELVYADIEGLTFAPGFDAETLSFIGDTDSNGDEKYAYRPGGYSQGGTLHFNTKTVGKVRVSFTDTGSSYSSGNTPRYLVINSETKEDYTYRGDANGANRKMDVVSKWYDVSVGDVTISGTKDIRVTKIEFATTDGDMEDSFTTREISGQGTTSKWIYGGYLNGVHGLVGGVEDNGILYFSNSYKGSADNGNGNIKFSIDSNGTTYLSCQKCSSIYIPVPDGCTGGTLSMSVSSSTAGRYFYLCSGTDEVEYIEDELIEAPESSKRLYSKSSDGPQSIDFTSSDFVENEFDGVRGNYLRLVDNGDEMKVSSFTITATGGGYKYEEPAGDEHGTLGKHEHAIFNYNDGTLVQGTDGFSNSTLWMGQVDTDCFVLTGEAPTMDDSKTYPIQSYRGGDLVRYKGVYYGALQLRSNDEGNAIYTLKAPSDSYITTSVRISGYENTDWDDNWKAKSYVSNFGAGVFSNDSDKGTLFETSRSDINSYTTTLDFTVPAVEEVSFKLAGEQFFGVIDAIYVKKNAVPSANKSESTTSSKVEYSQKNSVDRVPLSGEYGMILGGTIYFTPANDNQELWWYFQPLNDNTTIGGERKTDNEDDSGNVTKEFKVRNYDFTKNTGEYVIDTKGAVTQPEIAPVADGPETLKITVNGEGYFYYYINDTSTGFNSVLTQSGFGPTTGIKEIGIDKVEPGEAVDGYIYNIYGQRVDETYRGLVIKNGKKYVQR
ncbi:MAG: hypothetical protein J1E84_06740 [Muribaculaceae bacterium]|nr:hypothetical protein [Muribaculaceae bacterium]